MRPIYDMLVKASGRHRFHMPGHKGKHAFETADLMALDTTELPITDDLYSPERAIFQAEELYAEQARSAKTIFLHNGATVGIHTMLQLYAGEGDLVILPRNAHLSAINGCVIGGVRAAWIPLTQRTDDYCYIEESAVLAAMTQHPEAKAVFLTRPDFYGGCIPLKRIVEKAHGMGMKVVVDEAHGAHFPWLQGFSALDAGADAVTQSAHKTLMGLTGAAVLHLREAADAPRAMQILRREQTSSPSFLLMQSIDDSRAFMAQQGDDALRRLIEQVNDVRQQAALACYPDAHHAWQEEMSGYVFDPTRLVLEAPQGGEELAELLQRQGIDVEMHDRHRVVCIITVMDDKDSLQALTEVLRTHPPMKKTVQPREKVSHQPQKKMELRQAVMAMNEAIPLQEAEGRIAAQSVGLYPPGIPLIAPGEIISGEVIDLLCQAGTQGRFGIEEGKIVCVKQ